jgi:hypothetical protein
VASHDKPQSCGPSEFSHGEGMFPDPNIDYDRGQINPPNNRTRTDQLRDMIASKRTNLVGHGETLEEMTYAKGNPDRYGGHPPIVKQGPGEPMPREDLREPIHIFEREG